MVLFLDETFVPDRVHPFLARAPWLISTTLRECLSLIRSGVGALNVLKPLVAESLEEVEQQLPTWKEEIESLGFG